MSYTLEEIANSNNFENEQRFIGLEKYQKLQAEKEKLVRCVEFYADVNNWKSGFSLKVDDTKLTNTGQLRRGGKRARQCLQELKEGGACEDL